MTAVERIRYISIPITWPLHENLPYSTNLCEVNHLHKVLLPYRVQVTMCCVHAWSVPWLLMSWCLVPSIAGPFRMVNYAHISLLLLWNYLQRKVVYLLLQKYATSWGFKHQHIYSKSSHIIEMVRYVSKIYIETDFESRSYFICSADPYHSRLISCGQLAWPGRSGERVDIATLDLHVGIDRYSNLRFPCRYNDDIGYLMGSR